MKIDWDQISFREAVELDYPFIYSTWLRGLYHGNEYFNAMPAQIFYSHYKSVIKPFIETKVSNKLIACLKEDHDVILGYSVTRSNILDWIFVKPPWRNMGLAKELIPAGITKCTHLTKTGLNIKPKSWVFNPF